MEFDSLTALQAQVADLRGKIRALGSVNVSAIEEYKEVKARYDELSRQVTDVEAVSYTHLDVYKRQAQRPAVPESTPQRVFCRADHRL